jgi:hypothetical protein
MLMRWTFAVVVGVLLLLQPAYFFFLKPCERSICRPADTVASLCLDADHDYAEAIGIEDRALKRLLIRQGVSLIERGRAVESAALVKQLDTTSCELDLPRSGPSISDSAELFRVAKDSVVVVGGLYKCNKCTNWHVNIASGFVLSSHGAIVTNYHVVDSATERTMVVMTADSQVYPVQRVLAASRADDLAILQVDAQGLQPLPLADSTAPAPVGSAVSVISHPDGRFFCYTAGVVSRYMKIQAAGGQADAVAITAEYARGSSGAPVLNSQGQVVAVVSSTESIYYSQDGAQQRNLQMVFRTCVPTASLRKMMRPVGQMARWTP